MGVGKAYGLSLGLHLLLAVQLWRMTTPAADAIPHVTIEAGWSSVASAPSVAADAPQPVELPPVESLPDTPAEPEPSPVEPERQRTQDPPPEAPRREPVELARAPRLVPLVERTETERPDAPPPPPREQPLARAEPPERPVDTPQVEVPAVASVAAEDLSGSQVDRLPEPLPTNPAPTYPAEAVRAGYEGLVELYVLVAADGTPAEVTIHRSSGVDALDRAALSTVRDRWKFRPAQRGRAAVHYAVLVPVRFRLRG